MSKEISAKELQRQALAKAYYERITGGTAKPTAVPIVAGVTKGAKAVTKSPLDVTKVGRPKIHASATERQRARRARLKAKE